MEEFERVSVFEVSYKSDFTQQSRQWSPSFGLKLQVNSEMNTQHQCSSLICTQVLLAPSFVTCHGFIVQTATWTPTCSSATNLPHLTSQRKPLQSKLLEQATLSATWQIDPSLAWSRSLNTYFPRVQSLLLWSQSEHQSCTKWNWITGYKWVNSKLDYIDLVN